MTATQEGGGEAFLATEEGSGQALLAIEGSGQAPLASKEGSRQVFSTTDQPELQTPKEVIQKNSNLWSDIDAGKLANKLARYAYFGDSVLALSTVIRRERNALDANSIHSDLYRVVFEATTPLREFEATVISKINASSCRRLRSQKSLKC